MSTTDASVFNDFPFPSYFQIDDSLRLFGKHLFFQVSQVLNFRSTIPGLYMFSRMHGSYAYSMSLKENQLK